MSAMGIEGKPILVPERLFGFIRIYAMFTDMVYIVIVPNEYFLIVVIKHDRTSILYAL